MLYGLASEELYYAHSKKWSELPRPDIFDYQTDHAGFVPGGY
ncbi:hypothetical protein SH601_04815 [Gracilibacillus sp. S3-1-1]|uniref:Uncharacterized protein n=1 Tax=Gracilibacillus pellucidus TaxID=3095368 RepID=A0ACC6M2Z2_9BACI|nr:hypothetical protein [Gracilibacillus sp. S3-1-1]MDX8045304.1 hypothetical protein [Gracilibacillus sp. S3-1-1]